MSKPYKAPNGRIIQRQRNGKFRKTTLSDFGIAENSDYRYCPDCGYGKKEAWLPIVDSAICPHCGKQNSKPIVFKLSEKAIELQLKIKEISEAPFIDPKRISELRQLQNEFDKEYSETQKCYFGKPFEIDYMIYRSKMPKVKIYVPKTIKGKKEQRKYIKSKLMETISNNVYFDL